jgi:hypothetical protein
VYRHETVINDNFLDGLERSGLWLTRDNGSAFAGEGQRIATKTAIRTADLWTFFPFSVVQQSSSGLCRLIVEVSRSHAIKTGARGRTPLYK